MINDDHRWGILLGCFPSGNNKHNKMGPSCSDSFAGAGEGVWWHKKRGHLRIGHSQRKLVPERRWGDDGLSVVKEISNPYSIIMYHPFIDGIFLDFPL